MLSKKYFLFFLLLSGSCSYAQNSLALKGVVKDARSGEALPGVVIRLGENEEVVSTDAEGRFRFTGLREGEYRFTVSCVSYVTRERAVTVNRDLQLDILLEKRIVGLEEVSVTAKARTLGSGSVIERSAIIHTQPTSLADVLQLVPGQLASNPDLG
ncbi:MAG: TonB-dependent receptor, partial [Leadbetterella sp.]|nr:TonB-dependent receptor [Leadbetterella sp.]